MICLQMEFHQLVDRHARHKLAAGLAAGQHTNSAGGADLVLTGSARVSGPVCFVYLPARPSTKIPATHHSVQE